MKQVLDQGGKMVECLLSKPATGKTEYCIQKILTVTQENPFCDIWVITPGSYQSRYFRERLAANGTVFGVVVGTFLNFSNIVLERENSIRPNAPLSLRAEMIAGILERRRQLAPLKAYAPIEKFSGFVKVLRDTFTELETARVESARLYQQVNSEEERELASLYEEYLTLLENSGWDTPSNGMARAAARLVDNPAPVSEVKLIIVDGFDEFTNGQLEFLAALVKADRQILITLPGEEGSGRTAHRKGLTVLKDLQERFPLQLLSLTETPHLPPTLLMIEDGLFERAVIHQQTDENGAFLPHLLECRSPEAEVREALRWIKERIIHDNVPIGECAIFASDDTFYETYLRPIAEEYKLPVYFFHRRKFPSIPAGAAILGLLQLPAKNFERKALSSIFRSPYFEIGLSTLECSYLEQIGRIGQIVRGKQQWPEVWSTLSDWYSNGFPGWLRKDDLVQLPPQSDLPHIRETLNSFFNLFPAPDEKRATFQWAAWFENTLTKLNFYKKADVEESCLICDALKESFELIRMREDLFGQTEISYAQFAELLSSALSELGVEDPNQTKQNAIFFGSFIEARAVRYRAVCLIGMGEGMFPRRQREDPFLSESLRSRLGIGLRLETDQPGIFYQAITRADQYLLITRYYLTESGDLKRPSSYWEDILNCLPDGTIRNLQSGTVPEIHQLASIEEAAFYFPFSIPDAKITENIKLGSLIVNSRNKKADNSIYDGSLTSSLELFSTSFSDDKCWSPTAVEVYGKCPFTFFVGNVLGLREVEDVEEELGPNHIGTIFHIIFERLFHDHPNEKDSLLLSQFARQIAVDVFASAPERFHFRPNNLWHFRQIELLEKLEKTLSGLVNATLDWTPLHQEFSFGMLDNPPAVIDFGNGTIKFRGIIDRVDSNINGELMVLDYKLGGSFTKSDFIQGRVLQFMIYALAAEQLLNKPVVLSAYWQVNGAKFSTPKWEGRREDEKTQKDLEILNTHLKNFLENTREGRFPPRPSKNKCSPYCPALTWCWQADPERGKYR